MGMWCGRRLEGDLMVMLKVEDDDESGSEGEETEAADIVDLRSVRALECVDDDDSVVVVSLPPMTRPL